MTKKLKSKNQVKSDIDLLSDALTRMKEAIEIFYGEYYDWEHNYSRIGIKYYEALEDAYEKLDFASKRAEKKYGGSGENIDWRTTTHEAHYKDK